MEIWDGYVYVCACVRALVRTCACACVSACLRAHICKGARSIHILIEQSNQLCYQIPFIVDCKYNTVFVFHPALFICWLVIDIF